MSFYKDGCPDCGGFSFVDDYRQGDTICTQCGLVVQERFIVDDYFYNATSYEDHEEIMYPDEGYNYSNYNIHRKMEAACIQLSVPQSIQDAARTMFDTVRKNKCFKGNPLNALVGCCIYLSYNTSSCLGISREMKDICIPLGIDMSSFHKTLKSVYDILPHLSREIVSNTNSDGILRKIQTIECIPENMRWSVKKEVDILESIRQKNNILMGSSPSVINYVLIYVACEILNIAVDKKKFIEDANISRATLDKHTRLVRQYR
jgi:transcription initiation factor TFIIIB Brf1 subunit/transcription initiation factor TFIIB